MEITIADERVWLLKEQLSGELRADGKIFRQYIGKMLDPEFLFDIGVDTIDMLDPGGGIAVKLMRKGFSSAKRNKA